MSQYSGIVSFPDRTPDSSTPRVINDENFLFIGEWDIKKMTRLCNPRIFRTKRSEKNKETNKVWYENKKNKQ